VYNKVNLSAILLVYKCIINKVNLSAICLVYTINKDCTVRIMKLKIMSVPLIIVILYTWIPCGIRIVSVHLCCMFENHSFCSYRLPLVTGFANRTKETRKVNEYRRTRQEMKRSVLRASLIGPQNVAATYTGNIRPN